MDTFNQPHYYDEITKDILLVYRSNVHHYDMYHRHNGYEIYIFLKGNVNFLVENSCVHLERGNIAIINPTEYHRAVSLDNSLYERITLNISSSMLRSLSTGSTNFNNFFDSKQHGVNNIILLPEDILNKLLSLIDSLNDAFNSDSFGNDVLQKAYLAQILHLICNNYIVYKHLSVNIMPPLVSDTMQYIENHIHENFSLNDIEKALSFNNRYISRMFKQSTGISLKQYILEKKITLAQKLLAEGCSVTDACYNSGFNDYSNFIRTFKQYTGTTPGSFKKSK